MDIILIPLLLLCKAVINLAEIVIIVDVLMGWLVMANILNKNNQFVHMILDSFSKISEFMLRPIRKRITINTGSLDISPIVLLLLLQFVEYIIGRIYIRFI
jgi:YggT family protein